MLKKYLKNEDFQILDTFAQTSLELLISLIISIDTVNP